MPNTQELILGPGPLAVAVTHPYSASTLWETGDYCTYNGKIYKFIGEDLESGEAWTPAHWSEVKVTDVLANLQTQINALNPESGTGLFTDADFTINANQWTESNGVWSYNYSNGLIKATSGVAVYYTSSYRTALAGDINAEKHTGYVTFTTNGQPQGALSGTMRIIDSVSGVVSVNKGGTGAVTAKGARQNLNVSIKPIQMHFANVSSIPTTSSYDADINGHMIAQNWRFSNPAALPKGVNCSTSNAGTVTLNFTGITGGSITGTTDIDFELVDPRTVADGGSGQEVEQSAADYVQITAQTLTTAEKTQARTNIGAADAETVSELNSKMMEYSSSESNFSVYGLGKTIVDQRLTGLGKSYTAYIVATFPEIPYDGEWLLTSEIVPKYLHRIFGVETSTGKSYMFSLSTNSHILNRENIVAGTYLFNFTFYG